MASRILRVKGTACDVVFFFPGDEKTAVTVVTVPVVEEGGVPVMFQGSRLYSSASAPVMWSEKVCGVVSYPDPYLFQPLARNLMRAFAVEREKFHLHILARSRHT